MSEEQIYDIWESQQFSIDEEATSSQNGVLAVVEGPAFFPGSVSGNRVKYTLEAWESAINRSDLQERLRDRLVYGTIGHGLEINDEAVREGKFSHIVESVWIDENNVGQARYLVLDTGPGRVLNTVLRAGSKLRVSTKAKGLFESAPDESGAKVVIPETFNLKRIDFVLEPGYKEAYPELLESLDPEVNKYLEEENTMAGENTEGNDKAVEVLESQISGLQEQITSKNSDSKELWESLSQIKESAASMKTRLEFYEEMGTPKELQESVSLLEQYKTLGEYSEVNEALDRAKEEIDRLRGVIDNQRDQISESLQTEEVQEELNKYREFGTPEEVSEMLNTFESMLDDREQEQVTELAKKFDVEESAIKDFLEHDYTLAEVDESLTKIKGPQTRRERTTDHFKHTSTPEGSDISESRTQQRVTNASSRAGKLMANRK